ncbi:hypothetical protein WAE58_04580 [Pedobacter panaciterrae]|uniref:CRP-like cAMP-binding protein n=1 Tax=Pedobacter panaciterrae TaxID=363849 RepID=A0ABU8NKD2_9SPHI
MMHPVSISDESFHALLKIIESVMVLSVKFKLALRGVLYETTFERDSRILQSGRVQDTVWLLLTGLAREIRLDEHSFKERTSWFWLAGDFLCTSSSFFSRDASERTIEILERSRVVLISYQDWHLLMDSFNETELLTEKLRRSCDKARLQHAGEIKHLDTESRYLSHRKLIEHLSTRTKQMFIADMMGMAPDTLGRLKRKYAGLR